MSTDAIVGSLGDVAEGKGLTIIEAINQALAYELAHDERVYLFGEDIGKSGGVFRATEGLQKHFGKERVKDTPLAENAIAGIAVGMAACGLKPVVEIQFMGFMSPAFDQLISHASRLRWRTRGRLSCPMVLRAPYGGKIHAPELHSESTEAVYAHIQGLRVVILSSPRKAYGLLLAAIRDPDPVIFLEPKRIYRSWIREEVPDNGEALLLDTCFVVREGTDVTLVAWGAMMKETLEAAEKLEAEDVHAEVIDVATLKYLDIETIGASVEKTGRCVIVHEAPLSGGFGAEIAARLSGEYKYHFSLRAPIKRVTGYDTIMPLARLEDHYMPSVESIVNVAEELMKYT